jgi:hypothetical protein
MSTAYWCHVEDTPAKVVQRYVCVAAGDDVWFLFLLLLSMYSQISYAATTLDIWPTLSHFHLMKGKSPSQASQATQASKSLSSFDPIWTMQPHRSWLLIV